MKRPGKSGRMKKDLVSTWSAGTGSSGGTSRLARMSRSRSRGRARRRRRRCRCEILVARVEQHGAARAACRRRRGRSPPRDGIGAFGVDRPVDERVEGQLVRGDVDAGRLAGLQRRLLDQEARQAVEPGAADRVDAGIAGDDIGDAGRGDAPRSRRRRPAWRPAARGPSGDEASGRARRAQPRRSRRRPACRCADGAKTAPPIQKHGERVEHHQRQRGSHERAFQVARFVESIAQFGDAARRSSA